MKCILLILALTAFPWTVRAQARIKNSLSTAEHQFNWWIDEFRQEEPTYGWLDLTRFLDSLYRASREGRVRDSTYKSGYRPRFDTIIYIREYIPLDSVPIVKCEIVGSYDYIGTRSHWVLDTVCDTTDYRITKEKIVERKMK